MSDTTFLRKGFFGLIQGNTFKGGKPSLNLTNNNDGTFTIDVSFSVTFKPDVPVDDTHDTDLKNDSEIDYAGFNKLGGQIASQSDTSCQFRASGDGIVFGATSIKTSGDKINHGEKVNHGGSVNN